MYLVSGHALHERQSERAKPRRRVESRARAAQQRSAPDPPSPQGRGGVDDERVGQVTATSHGRAAPRLDLLRAPRRLLLAHSHAGGFNAGRAPASRVAAGVRLRTAMAMAMAMRSRPYEPELRVRGGRARLARLAGVCGLPVVPARLAATSAARLFAAAANRAGSLGLALLRSTGRRRGRTNNY